MFQNNPANTEKRCWWLFKLVMLENAKAKNNGHENASRGVGDNNYRVDNNSNAGPHAHSDDIDNNRGDNGEPHGRDDGHVGDDNDDSN